MDSIEASSIKLWLAKVSPCIPLTDKPMFKLVWSDDEYELRNGVKQIYYGSMKVGEQEVVETFPKYTYIKARWILEMWRGPQHVDLNELPDAARGSYEPLYVFEDSKGKPLPLNQNVIELLIRCALRPASSSMAIRSRIFSEMAEKEAALDRYTMDAIDTSDVQSLLHHGEAIIVPPTYGVTSPNLRNKQ